jgi:hypothetical protein
MTVVAVGSVRSCGVTTLALGLAATWPTGRQVVLVEADPAGGTLAAASGWPPEPGLVSLAAAARRGGDPGLLWEHCHQLEGSNNSIRAVRVIRDARTEPMRTGQIATRPRSLGSASVDVQRIPWRLVRW